MATKRIIFVFHDLGLGGVQKKIIDIVRFLKTSKERNKKDRFKIAIILEKVKSYDLEDDIFFAEAIKYGCEVFYYKDKKGIDYERLHIPFGLFLLGKVFWFKPDVIVAFMESYSVNAILAKYIYKLIKGINIKIIVGYDNVASLFLKLIYGQRLRYLYWHILLKNFLKLANTIIVPSNTSKEDFVKKFRIKTDRIVVNKNWVTVPSLSKNRTKKYDLLYVGRIDKVKNLKLFVNIVYKLKKRNPNIRACIVGWGEMIESVLLEISKLKLNESIELAGSQRDVMHYYKNSRVFLLTSDFEGLPIVGLEAMSYRLPVVSSNYPGVNEMITENLNGYVCNTLEDYCSKIEILLRNNELRKKMGNNARRYILKEHSVGNLKMFSNLVAD